MVAGLREAVRGLPVVPGQSHSRGILASMVDQHQARVGAGQVWPYLRAQLLFLESPYMVGEEQLEMEVQTTTEDRGRRSLEICL